MTQNQISFYKAKEDKRHNQESEAISKYSNKIQSKHLQRQDAYTKAHYERSDTAGAISANASAINAQAAATNAATNRKNYEMNYDIEYGWTGDMYYPSGMPLSAQKKSAELQIMTLSNPDPDIYGQSSQMPAVTLAVEQQKANIKKTESEALNKVTSAYTSILNSVFGKGGVIKTVTDVAE